MIAQNITNETIWNIEVVIYKNIRYVENERKKREKYHMLLGDSSPRLRYI